MRDEKVTMVSLKICRFLITREKVYIVVCASQIGGVPWGEKENKAKGKSESLWEVWLSFGSLESSASASSRYPQPTECTHNVRIRIHGPARSSLDAFLISKCCLRTRVYQEIFRSWLVGNSLTLSFLLLLLFFLPLTLLLHLHICFRAWTTIILFNYYSPFVNSLPSKFLTIRSFYKPYSSLPLDWRLFCCIKR